MFTCLPHKIIFPIPGHYIKSFITLTMTLRHVCVYWCCKHGHNILFVRTCIYILYMPQLIRQNTWFTGGFYVNGGVRWLTGDVINDVNTDTFWNSRPTSVASLYNRVAYKYGKFDTQSLINY